MLNKFKEAMKDKDHPIWLLLALVLLTTSQILSKYTGTLAQVFRWVLFAAAVIVYGTVLYLNNRDRWKRKKAKKKKKAEEK